MKLPAITFTFILMFLLSNVSANGKDRVNMQKQLDEECEIAREKKLAPLRDQYVEECVQKSRGRNQDRAYCERFYSDYGAKLNDRAPLFYDLPECVEAFEYRKSYRNRKAK